MRAPPGRRQWRVRVAAGADLHGIVHGNRVVVPPGTYRLSETDTIDLLLSDGAGSDYLVSPHDLRPLVADERLVYLDDEAG